ncbi:MAG: urea carboxylase-associated family protein [Mesorhizobium sp.]|nr:urea carboxylase-associated family protein [Mesorhizobium sp.]
MSEIVIPARRGKAIRLGAGAEVKVINTHGSQVLDTWAFDAMDMRSYMSMEHTRSRISRIYIKAGDSLVDNRYQAIVTMVEDTSPGVHDILMCSCSDPIYKRMGCTEYHDNCEDNLHAALDEIGLKSDHTPAPLNLFMNYPVDDEGVFSRKPPVSRPGDYVTFRAERDIVLVLSACPQDLMPINGIERMPTEAHLAMRETGEKMDV